LRRNRDNKQQNPAVVIRVGLKKFIPWFFKKTLKDLVPKPKTLTLTSLSVGMKWV
jgi:hypothetical protein